MNDQYRLHIDIPLGDDPKEAKFIAEMLMDQFIETAMETKMDSAFGPACLDTINYRLGNDADRQKSNHLMVNENGHVSNKKYHVSLDSGLIR